MRNFVNSLFRLLPRHLDKQFYSLIRVGKGWSATSINTSIFRKDSLVSHDGHQYISYYDKRGNLILGKRESGKRKWIIKKSGLKGNVRDAHNITSMTVDGNGYLHVCYDMHNKKLKYARSKKPGSLKMKSIDTMDGIEEEMVTYPEFHKLSSDDILFAYRSGRSGNGNMVLKAYEVRGDKWTTLQRNLIDGENERNAYWQMCVDNNDTIHLSWVWRETPDVVSNHDLCYAKSSDGGKTWFKSDGTIYSLPITVKTAEIIKEIPQGSELINQTSICCDNSGNPYIATYWRDPGSDTPQYRIVWKNGNEWRETQMGARKSPFTLNGKGTKMIPISRPVILIRGKQIMLIFRDAERGSKVSMAITENLDSGKWEIKDLTSFSVDAWEPTYDTDLWAKSHILNLFVQETHQGDGENLAKISTKQTPVWILQE